MRSSRLVATSPLRRRGICYHSPMLQCLRTACPLQQTEDEVTCGEASRCLLEQPEYDLRTPWRTRGASESTSGSGVHCPLESLAW
eukprot:1296408-Amphidinium_carterae.2